MGEIDNNWTRRDFIKRVGVAGGSTALYETMSALNLINTKKVWAGPPRLPVGLGRGKKVVILGAGISGLTTAYLLKQAGSSVKFLKPESRQEDVVSLLAMRAEY